MKSCLTVSLMFVAATGLAQQGPITPKQSNKVTREAAKPRPLLKDMPGINQEWVKDYQRRTNEYWAKRTRPKEKKSQQQPLSKSPISPTALSVSAPEQVRDVPFASTANTVELTVLNAGSVPSSDISVEASDPPAWIVFSSRNIHLGPMNGNEQKVATLTFSVDKSAPVGESHTLSFAVRTASGESWTKEITIKVSPPDRFELFQNYPNPFNPSTTISYQLVADSKVSLKIYDILGREVQTLVDDQRQAGYHQEVFNASRLASGVYIYRIAYSDPSGHRSSSQKRMLLIK